jgi:hypothetical protein
MSLIKIKFDTPNALVNQMENYFIVYESRHYGMMASRVDLATLESWIADEENMTTFSFRTTDKIEWPEDGLLNVEIDTRPLLAWEIKTVSVVMLNATTIRVILDDTS